MSSPIQQVDILDHLNTAILLIDEALVVRYINDAAEQLLAVSGQKIIGEPVQQLFTEETDSTSVIEAIEKGNTFTKRETRLLLNNRQTITVDFAATPIETDDLLGSLIIELQPLDRILRISKEKALLATQENSRTLIRGMAHEIKNPLGGLRGAAQLLDKELPSDALKEYTHIIIEEADRLRNLVDRMLGGHSLPDMRMLNIHEILERVRSLIYAETNGAIVITRDYDPSTPDLEGDKSQLIQAILNIAVNAMQALQLQVVDKPCIRFKTRVLRQFTIGTQRHRLVCHLQITDNGPGIPQELQNTLFLPLVSGRPDGTGLGLSFAQSIINFHQGLIECDSQSGQTTFSIYLPLGPRQGQEKMHER